MSVLCRVGRAGFGRTGFGCIAAWLGAATLLSACAAGPKPLPRRPEDALTTLPAGSVGSIEVRVLENRPRVTLVARDGDPRPAIAVSFVVVEGPVASTALAALLESRLRLAGFDVRTRADRNAAHITWRVQDGEDGAERFIEAVATAFATPVRRGQPGSVLARERLEALKRHRLDSTAQSDIAACTGRLGLAPGEHVLDVDTDQGIKALESFRLAALQIARSSIAAVGPSPFCRAVVDAVAAEDGWLRGPPIQDPWPKSDVTHTYVATDLPDGHLRLTVAIRTPDPQSATVAAERLGREQSPLSSRLDTVAPDWRAVEIAGVARPRGGCLSVTAERERGNAGAAEDGATAADALYRILRDELGVGANATAASERILAAADPTQAAERAAWWALASSAPQEAPRRIVALAFAPAQTPAADVDAAAKLLPALERALAAHTSRRDPPELEHHIRVERGQGEMWVLVGSPCSPQDEGAHNDGLSALSAIAAIQSLGPIENVRLEPFISPDGVGILAHGPLLGNEAPAALGLRLGEAAARAIGATEIEQTDLAAARAQSLTLLEASNGRIGIAFDAFARAASPERPGWLMPLSYHRAASASLSGVQQRWRAMRQGRLRIAVLANADEAQARAAIRAVQRWRSPGADAPCPSSAGSPARTGSSRVELPSQSPGSQGLIGVVLPGALEPSHASAELTALALGGSTGMLAQALRTSPGATGRVRMLGGNRLAALVLDIRADEGSLAPAMDAARKLLERLAQGNMPELQWKRAGRELADGWDQSEANLRHRVISLWHGRQPAPHAATGEGLPTAAEWSAWAKRNLPKARQIEIVAVPK